MLPAPHGRSTLPTSHRRAVPHRRRLAWLSALATLVATLVALGGTPAGAAQAPGDEVPVWQTGWSWTYSTEFKYTADGTNVTINETVTYTVAGVENFQGQPAYKLNLTGNITGGSGSVAVDGIGNATLSNFGGNVTGTRYMRRSDLALLREQQNQNLTAKASVSILSANITASISLSMDPRRGWRLVHFPTQAGNSWANDVDVDYNGGFSYDAGSIGGSGSESFEGSLKLDGPTTVADENLAVPAGTISTRRALTQSNDGSTKATMWYAPSRSNAARLRLEIPQDGGSLVLDQRLATSSTPAPGTSLTSTATPSLTCAGGDVTVAGRLSTGAVGVPVTVALDRSPITPGATSTVTTTTTSNGNYTATVQAPVEADGYQRAGVRGSWGVVVTAGGATSVSTIVVTPQNCSAIAYTGDVNAPQGTTATVSATLTDRTGASAAGRTVTFALSGGATTTATTDASGVATAQINVAGPARAASITASYAGDSTHEPATTTVPFTVGTIATTTTVSADPSVVIIGDDVRFTAQVTPTHGATPTGTVRFVVDGADFGTPVALSNGSATSPALSTLGLGDHTVVAVYNGSADNTGSTSAAVTFRVRVPLLVTTTTSSVSSTSTVYGQPVTLSANVATATGTPTGEVVFTANGNEVGRAGVAADGTASLVSTDLPVGNNAIVATYTGDDVYAGSAASPRSVVVAKAAVDVELTTSSSSTVTGEAIGLSATVAVQAPGGGTPDGALQLVVDGANRGAPVDLVNGSATFPALTTLGAGTHTIAVTYAGTASYASGSDQVQQQVAAADTTVSLVAAPTPSVEEQEVALTATVSTVSPGSGNPTGTVTFFSGTENIGSAPLSGGTAVLELSDLEPGTHQLTARYAGSDDYNGSESDEVTHVVLEGASIVATTTTLTSSADPSTYGAGVTFEVTVVADGGGVPTGTVQFSVDGQDVGSPVPVNGSGHATLGPVEIGDPGDHTVIAAFTADPGWSGSGAIITQTVEAAAVQLALTSSDNSSEAGDEVRFSVDVVTSSSGATPTGFVQFAVDGQPLGAAVALSGGSATSPAIDSLTPGTHLVTASYSGDARYRPTQTQLQQSVAGAATTTTVAVAGTPLTYGDDLVITATVTPATTRYGAPTGPVQFLVDGALVASPTLAATSGGAGTATITLGSVSAGAHQVKAVYAGTSTFVPSSSTSSVQVAKRGTGITAEAAVLSVSPLGLPLGTLRATLKAGGQPLAGVPLTFKVGTKAICTITTDANGRASCNGLPYILQLTLSGGYTVSFAGDANHLSSTASGALLK